MHLCFSEVSAKVYKLSFPEKKYRWMLFELRWTAKNHRSM